jgi:hypothetical protein
MAYLFEQYEIQPVNPSGLLHAIERMGPGTTGMYGTQGAAFGPSREVLLQDWVAEDLPRLHKTDSM